MKKINLGSGGKRMVGYVNVDMFDIPGVDVVHDLNVYPWPFENNEFDEVYCSHVLEHLNDFYKLVFELHRISKPGAKILIFVPYFSGPIYWGDASHKMHFGYRTFDYYCRKPVMLFKYNKRKIIFSMHMKIWNRIFTPLINRCPRFYERFMCWKLPSELMEYELEVVK